MKKFISLVLSLSIITIMLDFNKAYAASDSFSWELHTGTAMHVTDSNFEFLNGDYNNDGYMDLYVISKKGGSNTTEVHILDGSNSYSTFLLHTATAQHCTDDNWTFELGDYNCDGKLDLYAICKNANGSTELHVLNGADNFQSFILHMILPLGPTSTDYDFAVGDYNNDDKQDLYIISKKGESNTTEVHVLSGSDSYSTFILHTATAQHCTDDNWTFELGYYDNNDSIDLFAINRQGQNSTEIHVLNGSNNFQSHILHKESILGKCDDNYQFITKKDVKNAASIYVINRQGESNSTEVHHMVLGNPVTTAAIGKQKPKENNDDNNSIAKKREAIVAEAKKHLGKPYVWGAEGPNSFDCSGLVQYVYGQCGISLSRTTYTQVNEGKQVNTNTLELGDLVFFGSVAAPHHVGIYIGNGEFIHAPQTGDVVKITKLIYMTDFSTARRIIN